ncbi:transposase [Fibrella aquatica]|uniref:transposase n=1 Tax=Fibrella aquatica TaxID=3242487 RepID=UPI003522EFB8
MKQYYRDLPHIQPVYAIFFVTARLHGSLPMAVLEQLREEQTRANLLDNQQTKVDKVNQRKRDFARFDTCLDNPQNGPYWLAKPAVANVLMEAIRYRHDVHFELVAFCVMSNHYHLVIDTRRLGVSTRPLHRILQSLHAYVAKSANVLLERSGTFWHDESCDHIVRDDRELRRIIEYTLENPVKAGLVDEWEKWPYSYVNKAYW